MSSDTTPPLSRSETQKPKVVIVGVPGRETVRAELERLRPAIAEHAEIVAEDLSFSYNFSQGKPDLVIVLGGDGSILQTARQMGAQQSAVLGINCGRLGFLAALSPDDFLNVWPEVSKGKFEVIDHLMLQTSLIRDGRVIAQQLALNEVAVLVARRTAYSTLIFTQTVLWRRVIAVTV